MKSFWKLTLVECKLYFRFPIAAFFTLALLPMILLLLGAIFGNGPSAVYGGKGFLDVAVPGFIALVIAISAIMSLPMALANYRERGILRRYRATPVSPAAILGAQLVTQFAMTILGMLLLILIGKLLFHLQFEGNIVSVLAAFTLGCLSFFSIGMVLAGVLPNTRVGTIVGNVLLQPMVYLSGVTIPKEVNVERNARGHPVQSADPCGDAPAGDVARGRLAAAPDRGRDPGRHLGGGRHNRREGIPLGIEQFSVERNRPGGYPGLF